MTVLLTGGAGYIGAHVVASLQQASMDVVVVDDLSTGRRERIPDVPLLEVDLSAPEAEGRLAEAMTAQGVTTVIHLAAKKRVDESLERPSYYYAQNVVGMQHVLNAMVVAGVRQLVFSSSAAVYGETTSSRVDESHPTLPMNPYGRTKLIGEWMCRDFAAAGLVDAIALRYFNVAGAARPALGDPEVLNLVTIVIDRLRRGLPPAIYGDDYPTSDGTCVRDFVHVGDLAAAHVTAVSALQGGTITGFEAFNVGTGVGGSVSQVVDRLIQLSQLPLSPVVLGRRPGDPASVVASADRIKQRLGWVAKAGLNEILESAWAAAHFPR